MVIGCLGCVGAVKESRPLLLTVNHFEGGLLTLRHPDTGGGANVLKPMLRFYRKKTMLTSLTIVNSTSLYFGAAP